jgi:hypothetical protein
MMNRTILATLTLISATTAGCVVEEGDDLALGSDEQATCNVPTGCQPEQTPPTDPPPPPPTSSATGKQLMSPIRLAIDAGGQQAINDFNADPGVPGTLAWRAAGPFTCDYACNMGMQMPLPGFPYAWTDSTLKMRWSWGVFHRNVTTTVETRAYCAGWQYGGTGDLIVTIDPAEPVVEGGGYIEGLLDFFSGGHLTSYINDEIANGTVNAGATVLRLGKCTSLGVKNGFPSSPLTDAFVWNKPTIVSAP